MARIRFTILGCGSSGGVPRLGGLWGACDPTNPKNRRRRCSLLIERFAGADPEAGVTRVLIDSTDGDRAWSTIGVSENVIEASWQALADSVIFGLLKASA